MEKRFPTKGVDLTHILVVANLDRARSFYRHVLGATVYREYAGASCVLRFQGSWLLVVTGGGPTADKPDARFEPPQDPQSGSHSMIIRVPHCEEAYEVLRSRGAEFLTPPYDWGGEIRCFFRDPYDHLLEISQAVQ